MSSTGKFEPFATKMEAAGMPDVAIKTFEHYYTLLAGGQTGMIPESDIEPVESLPDSEGFGPELEEAGRAALGRVVMIKLNGGLGTSMGLEKAKSLLVVKKDFTFLDIIARQAINAGVPLVLMNSFATREDTLDALRDYKELQTGLPIDFLQHKVPKVDQRDLSPVEWPANPELEWCPPGHGDIYTALVTSGLLETLTSAGYRYAFVSNSDNLGAVLDARILGYFATKEISFMMEASNKTAAHRKGGHLASRTGGNGGLLLRESAQCPQKDEAAFQDISRHKYFNTNNLWINLDSLWRLLRDRNNLFVLPMIRNAKTVDPRDSTSTPVYQLETAMGAAISVFEGAEAIRVPRSRFAPVKTTNDLLAVRSDATVLTWEFRIETNPQRKVNQLDISLDSRYYKLVSEMEKRFPYGPPSLLECTRLTVEGDIRFGKNVVLKGDVDLENDSERQREIPDSSVIEG